MEIPIPVYKNPIVVFMGVPGVGKSVLAKQVAENLEFTVFSFNRYAMMMTMRRDINPISDKIRKFQAEGKPIDDPTKVEVVSNFFRCTMAKSKGLLFDAFPENLALMEKLKDIMPIKAVINLTTKEDILMEKFAGRRECTKCFISRSVYNVAKINKDGYDLDPLLPTKEKDKCDQCKGDLVQSDADKPEAVAERIKKYKDETASLEEYFRKQGILKDFECKKGVKDVPLLEAEIRKLIA